MVALAQGLAWLLLVLIETASAPNSKRTLHGCGGQRRGVIHREAWGVYGVQLRRFGAEVESRNCGSRC